MCSDFCVKFWNFCSFVISERHSSHGMKKFHKFDSWLEICSNNQSPRFPSFMTFLIPSIQFFFGLPRAHFCFGIYFNAILGNLLPTIFWTWPYHVSWFCSISFIIVSSSPICCLIVTFLILSFRDILQDLRRASMSVACFSTIQILPAVTWDHFNQTYVRHEYFLFPYLSIIKPKTQLNYNAQ